MWKTWWNPLGANNPTVTVTGNYATIQRLAIEWNIASGRGLTKIKIGWVGKPKGIYQLLWERGFLDPNNLNKYTINGWKDQFGIHQPHTSLKYLHGSCWDFQEEESLLQINGMKAGRDRQPYTKVPLWISWGGYRILMGVCKIIIIDACHWKKKVEGNN